MAGCLDGVRVIDLGRYQAGPRCSMILGDLGAEVIKVEAAPDGDESRGHGQRGCGAVEDRAKLGSVPLVGSAKILEAGPQILVG